MQEFIESPQGAPDGLCGQCGFCCSCKSCPGFSGAFVMATGFAFLSLLPSQTRGFFFPTEAPRGPLCPPCCHHQEGQEGCVVPVQHRGVSPPFPRSLGARDLRFWFFMRLKDVFVGSVMRQSVVIRLFQRVCRHRSMLWHSISSGDETHRAAPDSCHSFL